MKDRYELQVSDSPKAQIDYVADVDCNHCREGFIIIEKLMKDYQKEANFYFVPFVASPSFSSRVAHATDRLGKFPAFFSMIVRNHAADSGQYSQSAIATGLKPADLQSEEGMSELNTLLKRNFSVLVNNNIGTTPTVIVNGQVYYGLIAYEDLKDFIEGVLNP